MQTAAAMGADTLASLVSTAWVGRLGSEELAAVGVALSLYVAATKLVNTPLLIVSVSIVAAAVGEEEERKKGGHLSAAAGAAMLSSILIGGPAVYNTTHAGRAKPPGCLPSPCLLPSRTNNSAIQQPWGWRLLHHAAAPPAGADGAGSGGTDGVGLALSGTIMAALIVGLVEGLALGVGAVPGLELWGAGRLPLLFKSLFFHSIPGLPALFDSCSLLSKGASWRVPLLPGPCCGGGFALGDFRTGPWGLPALYAAASPAAAAASQGWHSCILQGHPSRGSEGCACRADVPLAVLVTAQMCPLLCLSCRRGPCCACHADVALAVLGPRCTRGPNHFRVHAQDRCPTKHCFLELSFFPCRPLLAAPCRGRQLSADPGSDGAHPAAAAHAARLLPGAGVSRKPSAPQAAGHLARHPVRPVGVLRVRTRQRVRQRPDGREALSRAEVGRC
jgi:hypothetical protein